MTAETHLPNSYIGHPRGADASAIFFSVIETAKANGLEPNAYFKDLFGQFPTTAEKNYPNRLPTNIDPETIGLAKL